MKTKRILHITNGQVLTDYLQSLKYEGDTLTWQEMLCEGPTIAKIDSDEFLDVRKAFLKEYYDIEVNTAEVKSEISKLDSANDYDEIVLWFEYDLFCHINLIGVMNLIHQKEITTPLSLVCSGRVDGNDRLTALPELKERQLHQHYKARRLLTEDDMQLMIALWRTYNSKDHNIFKMYITERTDFKYLSNCLKAHLKRFPDSVSGLSTLETNILKLIDEKRIVSEGQLLGYCLNHQGYYGFGDLQFKRMLKYLASYFEMKDKSYQLTEHGKRAITGITNEASIVKNTMIYGGVNRLDYHFDVAQNKLINPKA
ncbi:DUF1835 domain-containing protein [Winogradskyella maritima]|uniref:DUF1835 domain-containing protein n=1 Tax=Winogradskyella maritima TaxID=1517766 RepID=A0ABV8AIW3_9FLAO|nr:DUF1835 domain-containing protein [Winogradskyella maritima]